MSNRHIPGRRWTRWLKALAVVAVAATTALAYPSGAPTGTTAAPGEDSCTRCHGGVLNDSAGSIAITGVPDVYEPGRQYTLTVKLSHATARSWGFQLTALDGNNHGVGTFAATDTAHTRMLNGGGAFSGRTYIDSSSGGAFDGQSGSATWQVAWTAPANDKGRITFYAAGLAANNNGSASGDSTYTTSVKSGTNTPMVIAPVYKNGKIILQNNGSNIDTGATLQLTGGATTQTEEYPLVTNAKQTKWVVRKSARSTPSGLSVADAWPAGTTVSLVVSNPDGTPSAPVSASH